MCREIKEEDGIFRGKVKLDDCLLEGRMNSVLCIRDTSRGLHQHCSASKIALCWIILRVKVRISLRRWMNVIPNHSLLKEDTNW